MRTVTFTDKEFADLRSRLSAEWAAQRDAARQADKTGVGNGDGWREQAERTRQLIAILEAS